MSTTTSTTTIATTITTYIFNWTYNSTIQSAIAIKFSLVQCQFLNIIKRPQPLGRMDDENPFADPNQVNPFMVGFLCHYSTIHESCRTFSEYLDLHVSNPTLSQDPSVTQVSGQSTTVGAGLEDSFNPFQGQVLTPQCGIYNNCLNC